MEELLTCLPRLTLAQLRTLRSITECTCHRDLENFPLLPIEVSTFCSLFAGWRCQCPGWHSDHLIVHHQWELCYRCAHSCSKLLIAPMGKWLTCLPRLTLAQLRTLRSTTVCTCRTLKTSHCPDGRLTFCSLFAGRRGTCHRDPEKFSSPRGETHVLLVVCREAVSLSRVAQ